MTIVLAPATLVSVASMPIFFAHAAPLVIALAIRVLLYADIFHLVGVFMMLGMMGLLTHLALYMNKAIERSIRLREEKTALVDELFKAKRESDLARARAEETSRAKSQFLANMSHELRTPLNAIIGFSEVMGAEILGPHQVAAYKEYLKDIHHSGQHLLGLINDILDLSRIESGHFQVTEEDVDIVHLAEDCSHLLDIRASTQNVTVKTDFESNLPLLRGDARAIRQIWINLLTNAIKFSPAGSTVTMIIRHDPDGNLRFGVHDNGSGISEKEIAKVVEAFQQGEAGLAQPGSKGTGLGLSIVKGLLEAHGGHFEIRSKLGKGTQAEAVFPASRLLAVSPDIKRVAG
jgi:two-component system cell cycle sensor histidine kinase PleC